MKYWGLAVPASLLSRTSLNLHVEPETTWMATLKNVCPSAKGLGQRPEEFPRVHSGPHHGGQILTSEGGQPVTTHLSQFRNGLTHLLFIKPSQRCDGQDRLRQHTARLSPECDEPMCL
eukprot:5831107-Pyramimonas_sp.AAC.1